METLFVIYDEAFQEEISGVIERDMVVARYSRLDNVIGARMAQQEEQSGYLADRRNRMIMVVSDPTTIARIVANLRELRTRRGHGLRAFVVPTTEVI